MNKKVYLFSTCVCSSAMPQTVINAIELLRLANVDVIYKKNQTCCSQPSYNSGYFEESKKIVLHNVALFEEDESLPIVVPAGSCAGMFSHDILELFKGDKEFERIKRFSERVYDLSQYLHKVCQVNYEDKGAPLTITWHTSCHAFRIQKCVDSQKALLSQFKNVTLAPLQYEEECCGFGGTFSIKEPEISNAIVSAKIDAIKHTGAKYVVAGDSDCILNIQGALKRQNSDIQVVHLYDFLLDRIKGANAYV